MKASKSKRNRHTGRVNAFKRKILEQGKSMTDSNGRQYRYMYFVSSGCSIVRADNIN